MNIAEKKSCFDEDFLEELRLLTLDETQENRIQDWLQGIAQRLIGEEWDFKAKPVYFCIADNPSPNAAFVPNIRYQRDEEGEFIRDEDGNKIPEKSIPMVMVTKGLFDFVHNEDELAFILGHELGHFRQEKLRGNHENSKVEEASSDYGALDMMIRGGYRLDAAHDVASRIFVSGDETPDLNSILARALDAHPNNQSRLNFIDISIVDKEKKLRRENINFREIAVTPFPEDVSRLTKEGRCVTFVERFLKERRYDDLGLSERLSVLNDCVDASEKYGRRQDAYSPYYFINGARTADLQHEFAVLLNDMRGELPRVIIPQSEADLALQSSFPWGEEGKALRQKRRELLQRLYKDEYDRDEKQVAELLSSYPYKVVADSEYERAVRENELLRRREIEALNAGRHPNLDLFADACDRSKPYGSFDVHKDRTNLYRQFIGASLLNMEPIPLNGSWRPGMRLIYDRAASFLENGDENDAFELISLSASVRSASQDSDELSKQKKQFSLPNLGGRGERCELRNKFSGVPLPDLQFGPGDVNRKIPQGWNLNRYDTMSIFGFQKKADISKQEWILEYNKAVMGLGEGVGYYRVNAEGVITAHYTSEQYGELQAEIKRQREEDVYGRLADVIRRDIADARAAVANPENTELPLERLNRLKVLTHGGCHTFGETIALEEMWFTEQLEYRKPEIRDYYFDDFYQICQSSSFFGAENMHWEDEVLKKYLTPEEKHWLTTFNHGEDMALFRHIDRKLRQSGENFTAETKIPRINFSPASSLSYQSVKEMRNFYHNGVYSLRQMNELTRTVLDSYPLQPNLAPQGRDSYNTIISGYNIYYQEMRHLYSHIVSRGGVDAVSYDDYRPLFAEKLRGIMNIPEFSLDTVTRLTDSLKENELNDRDNNRFAMMFEVQQGILRWQEPRFPLDKMVPALKYAYLNDAVAAKIAPYLSRSENWPADVRLCAGLAGELQERNQIADTPAVLETLLPRFAAEKDPQILTEALIKMSSVLQNDKISAERRNAYKDSLLQSCPEIWTQPLEQQFESYRRLCEANMFAADMAEQNKILRHFLTQIEAVPDIRRRTGLYQHFVLKENRIDDPELRREYHRLWVDGVFLSIGAVPDDNSAAYRDKVAPYVEVIKHSEVKKNNWGMTARVENVSMVDRAEILKLLADKLVSQQALSEYIKPEPSGIDSMEAGNLVEGHVAGVAFDIVKGYLESNPKNAADTVNFLLSDGSWDACDGLYRKMLKDAKNHQNPFLTGRIEENANPQKLSMFYREFWGYPLEARAVLINELLHTQASGKDGQKWEQIFDIVAARMFPDAQNEMNQIGREFLHSYIKSRHDEERTLYLSAMMVAANENAAGSDPQKSLARGIRLFLENSGPAAIKLGQAMGSCADVPAFLREEMQELKSNAARPARWDIYKWLEFYKKEHPEENLDFGKDVWLGRILGSASYFVTLEKGRFDNGRVPEATDRVIKILRAGAKLDSDSEFKVFEDMLFDLKKKGVLSGGMDSFLRLVGQARESAVVETDLTIGRQQLQTAQEIYPQAVEINGRRINVHVAGWPEHGTAWAELERAQGIDFEQIKDDSLRRDIGKAYFTVEMVNMLSGGRFDHDRHGKQLKVDLQTNTLGLFDTGAMAVVDPSPQDRELLGKILYRTANRLLTSEAGTSFGNVGAALSAEIDEAYASGAAQSPYLTEFQRGLLALSDFYKDFKTADFIDCFNSALNSGEKSVDTHIMKGFISEGIASTGLFAARQNLLSHQDKEQLGRLLFNVYAESLNPGTRSIKELVSAEIDKFAASGADIPLLKVIKSGLEDKAAGNDMALQLPPAFIPSLTEIISQQQADIGLLKGMMKEAVYAVNLQEEKSAYSAEDRRNFGRILYQTFAIALDDKKAHRPVDLLSSYREAVRRSPQRSSYAHKILAVAEIAASSGAAGASVETEAQLKGLLLSGNMDKEVVKGISQELVEQNPHFIGRQFMAKGIKYFMSQEKPQPGILKKSLVRLFVGKQNRASELEGKILSAAEDRLLNARFVEALKGYVKTAGDKLAQPSASPQIKLVTSQKNVTVNA